VIRVRVETVDGDIAGFTAKGHAGYDSPGKDIVCSAVSILLYNAVNSCEKLLGVVLDASDDGKTFTVRVAAEHLHHEGVQLLLKSMEFGLQQIAEQYPDYVKISTVSTEE
jgi:uncharacterized protein YsxB (DUF464 family)